MEATTRFRKCVVCLLLGGFALLLCEIRFEHREVLAEHWQAYLPLAYCGAMLPLGAMGVWFHTTGHPVRGVGRVLSAWLLRPGENGGVKPELSGPPAMAPFAFFGLGSIGLLACAQLRMSPRVS